MKFLDLLLEGKKENLIDRYKDNAVFADAPELLEKIIDGDPSATKKYSEWTIKQVIDFMNRDGQSLGDTVNHLIELIDEFHKAATSIQPGDIELGATMSNINVDKIKSGPKDINKYEVYWELETVLSAVKKRKIQKEKEAEIKKEVNKIYEDDTYLIVQPETHGASCYYGANTKWCTTTKDDTRYFDKYTDEGNLYYIIDKRSANSTFGKMALFVRSNGNTEVYDQQDAIRSLDILLAKFEPIKDKILPLVKGQAHYETLLKIKEGKVDPSRGNIKSDIIKHIEKDGDGFKVELNFGGVEKFLQLFNEDVEEGDLKYIEYTIEPPYGSDEQYYDPYNFDDELNEGYYLYSLNYDHLKVLKDMLQVYDPKIAALIKETPNGFDIDQDDYSTIGKFMNDNLESDVISNLSDAFSYAKDRALFIGLQKLFTEGLCNILEEIGIKRDGECFYNYEVSLDEVLRMYESEEYYESLSFTEMLQNYVTNHIDFPFTYPYEHVYENEDGETFNEEFNDETLRVLENAYEKFEDVEFIKDFDEYLRVLEELKKQFTIGKNIPVPTQEGVSIYIDGVDPQTNKINFKLKRFNGETSSFEIKKGRAKLSSLLSLMNNYQLFDPFE